MNETVYLVKFDCGYYAEKQPKYLWSYTDDPMLAKRYKSFAAAKERGEWGIGLISGAPKTYKIEQYVVKTIMELVI